MVPDNPYGWVVMKWTRPLCGPAAMSQNDFKTSETMQPQEASPVKHPMSVLGIDIAKRVFHVVGMHERGQIVLRKRLSRHDLIPFAQFIRVCSWLTLVCRGMRTPQ